MKAEEVYGSLYGEIETIASGFDHAIRTGDTTFSVFFVNGDKLDFTIPLPQDGVSIVDLIDNGDGTFKAKLSNGTLTAAVNIPKQEIKISSADGNAIEVKDDGLYVKISGSGSLEEALTATNAIGSVTSGKTYTKGTSLEKIIRDILIKEEAPTVTLTLTPSATLYDVVNDTLSSIKLTATVTKKTYDVAKVEWYAGTTLINTKTTAVGGAFDFTYTPSTPINKTVVFKVVVTDVKGKSSNVTKTVEFIAKSYNGTVADTMTLDTVTEDDIKALNDTLKNSRKYVYSGINMVYGKVLYAYPKSLGALTSIMDKKNNFNYTATYDKVEMTIDGIAYYVYLKTNPSKADNVELTFE